MRKYIFVAIQLEQTISQTRLHAHCECLKSQAVKIAVEINRNRTDENLPEFELHPYCDIYSQDGRVHIEAGMIR